MPDNLDDALAVQRGAERLCTPEQVETAFTRMAEAITAAVAEDNPLVLSLLNGGLIPTGILLPKLDFALQLDTVHVSRYRGRTHGDELIWYKKPLTQIAGRTVLLVDDILDEGHTLAGVVEYCREAGAERVVSAVLVDKVHQRKVPGLSSDIVGIEVEDRYLFGYGMDYKNYLRNAAGIFAVQQGD